MTKHWSEEPYWTEAIERFDANRERGTQLSRWGLPDGYEHIARRPPGVLARVGLDLAPDLAVVGGILRHHVRERERLCHRVRCRGVPRRRDMAPVEPRALVIVEIGPLRRGQARVGEKLVRPHFACIVDLLAVQALDHDQRRLALA